LADFAGNALERGMIRAEELLATIDG